MSARDEIEAGSPRGVRHVFWNNLVPGWQMECLCGFVDREPCGELVDAAQLVQDHWDNDPKHLAIEGTE